MSLEYPILAESKEAHKNQNDADMSKGHRSKQDEPTQWPKLEQFVQQNV